HSALFRLLHQGLSWKRVPNDRFLPGWGYRDRHLPGLVRAGTGRSWAFQACAYPGYFAAGSPSASAMPARRRLGSEACSPQTAAWKKQEGHAWLTSSRRAHWPCRDFLIATTRASTKPTGSGIPRQIQTGWPWGGSSSRKMNAPPRLRLMITALEARNPSSPR